LALQTREQHIRREKATSNICTAQVLLAVMASMYALWHGPEGLKKMALRVHAHTQALRDGLTQLGLTVVNNTFFDTLLVATGAHTDAIHAATVKAGINLRQVDQGHVAISFDETVTDTDVQALLDVLGQAVGKSAVAQWVQATVAVPPGLLRTTACLTHEVFSSIQSETDMLRYLRRLSDKDLALDRTMIPLGSCTMKLNATVEMIPVTWPEFANIHPFAPRDQTEGYQVMIERLSRDLCEITGYDAIS
jgi:glycine dehydrogenase